MSINEWWVSLFDKYPIKSDDLIKLELENNIYPSLKAVTNNRYLILIALFAYYAFRLTQKDIAWSNLDWPISFFFSLVIVHNYFNYYLKARVIGELIKKRKPPFLRKLWDTKMELFYALICLSLIWKAYQLIPLASTKSPTIF